MWPTTRHGGGEQRDARLRQPQCGDPAVGLQRNTQAQKPEESQQRQSPNALATCARRRCARKQGCERGRFGNPADNVEGKQAVQPQAKRACLCGVPASAGVRLNRTTLFAATQMHADNSASLATRSNSPSSSTSLAIVSTIAGKRASTTIHREMARRRTPRGNHHRNPRPTQSLGMRSENILLDLCQRPAEQEKRGLCVDPDATYARDRIQLFCLRPHETGGASTLAAQPPWTLERGRRRWPPPAPAHGQQRGARVALGLNRVDNCSRLARQSKPPPPVCKAPLTRARLDLDKVESPPRLQARHNCQPANLATMPTRRNKPGGTGSAAHPPRPDPAYPVDQSEVAFVVVLSDSLQLPATRATWACGLRDSRPTVCHCRPLPREEGESPSDDAQEDDEAGVEVFEVEEIRATGARRGSERWASNDFEWLWQATVCAKAAPTCIGTWPKP